MMRVGVRSFRVYENHAARCNGEVNVSMYESCSLFSPYSCPTRVSIAASISSASAGAFMRCVTKSASGVATEESAVGMGKSSKSPFTIFGNKSR